MPCCNHRSGKKEDKRVKNKLLSLLFVIFTVLFIISASIALPIYIRPFYYAHIEPYNLVERTGRSAEDIRDAYDEVLDYLTLPNKEFGSGVFEYSEEGKSHFADCKILFTLDTALLLISFAAIAVLAILAAKGVFKMCRPFGSHILLTCGALPFVIFAAIAAVASIDFDTTFIIFHKIFFPGKENWMFNPYTDEIIVALPQAFFANCAIFIASSIIVISLACVIFGLIEMQKTKNNEK